MNLTRDRLHAIGWGTAMAICLALLAVLTTQVNAVKSQVALADRQIAQLSQEKLYLETEFETRANQQQLRAMNEVDFGYTAPTAAQYLKSERDLAMLGKAAEPDAPQPIRYAAADGGPDAGWLSANKAAGGSGQRQIGQAQEQQGASLAGRLIGVARAAEAPSGHAAGSATRHATAAIGGRAGQAPVGGLRPPLKVASLNSNLGASLNERLSRLDRTAGAAEGARE